jgi:3-carboxy-cis,cis-muconate cycloisomerase
VTTILGDMPYEHERTVGTWQLEWRPLRDLLVAVGSAAAWLRESLEHLAVDERRMRANLDRLRRPLHAEGDPGSHLGNAPAFIDRALAAHRERRRRTDR